MRPAILFRLGILSIAALTIEPLASAQAKLAGDWQGTTDVNGTTYHVVWHLVIAPDGALASTIDNIDENVFGIKVKSTVLKGSAVALSVDDQIHPNGEDIHLVGSFAGTVAANGEEINGTWTQQEPEQAPVEIHFVHHTGSPTPSATNSPSPSIAGDWSGTLDAGPAQLRLVLHITGKPDSLSATIDSIDQGANGIPVKSVSFQDGKLNLVVEAVNGTYEGTVNKDATEIDGTWTQRQPLTLNFKRSQAHTTASAPKPAAPSDIDGTWTGKLETPAGQLTINLRITNTDAGLTAQLQSPDQSPNWAPANSITRVRETLTVLFKAFGASYEGKVSADHGTIDGKFTQMGNEIPLVLRKS